MFDVDACGIASGLCDEEQMCMVAGTWSINEFIRREPVTNGSVALKFHVLYPRLFPCGREQPYLGRQYGVVYHESDEP